MFRDFTIITNSIPAHLTKSCFWGIYGDKSNFIQLLQSNYNECNCSH